MHRLISRTSRSLTALFLAGALLLCAACSNRKVTVTPCQMTFQHSSVPNPMKGFASFYKKGGSDCSLEYIGLKFSDICRWENGVCTVNRAFLDPMLQAVADRKHHAILRVYMLYPGYNSEECTGLFLPEALSQELRKQNAIYSNPYEGSLLEYPDFNNETLIGVMTAFVDAFGREYDGHPAIAVIQMGLYGAWGEWNMSGCRESRCTMTNDNLRRLIEAYTASFRSTKLMGRNPSLGFAYDYDIGYHDDNFLFNTSDFHTKSPEWKALLRQQDWTYAHLQQFYDFIDGNSGQYPSLWDAWETQMFGGEMSSQMYKPPFGSLWSGTEHEALLYSMEQFHMSWLMGIGKGNVPDTNTADYEVYLNTAAHFGYDIGIVSVKAHTGRIEVSFSNYGIAPFYYDWPVEYWLTDQDGQVVFTYRDEDFRLSGLLPGKRAKSEMLLPDDIKAGAYTACLRFVNPSEAISKNVMPLRLANDHMVRDGVYEIAHMVVE